MPDRAQDTEAIRAALNANVLTIRDDGARTPSHAEAHAALGRLVARLEAAEDALREWLAYTGLRERAFNANLDPGGEYASGRALIRKTDAALAAAAPGETERTP